MIRCALWGAVLLSTTALADTTAVVIDVHDGDTVTLDTGERVRLADIDAPELKQPGGSEARTLLAGLINRQTVRVVERGRDRYGRLLGVIWLGERDVNEELVRAGAVWCFVRYLPPRSTCPAIEAEARAARRGLWADAAAAVAPWEWRSQQRRR